MRALIVACSLLLAGCTSSDPLTQADFAEGVRMCSDYTGLKNMIADKTTMEGAPYFVEYTAWCNDGSVVKREIYIK